MGNLYDELEYPKRAEFLDAFREYRVELGHWRSLSDQFSRVFRQIYATKAASVLLVYAPQGAGKSLFCGRLEEDYTRSAGGQTTPDTQHNLWHLLVAADSPDEAGIAQVTKESAVSRVDPSSEDWFTRVETAAAADRNNRVRIFLLDDAHQVDAMRGWLGISHVDFATMQRLGESDVRRAVAQKINADLPGCLRADRMRDVLERSRVGRPDPRRAGAVVPGALGDRRAADARSSRAGADHPHEHEPPQPDELLVLPRRREAHAAPGGARHVAGASWLHRVLREGQRDALDAGASRRASGAIATCSRSSRWRRASTTHNGSLMTVASRRPRCTTRRPPMSACGTRGTSGPPW